MVSFVMVRTVLLTGVLALPLSPPLDAADRSGLSAHRHTLQLQQQQDALNLQLRQPLPGTRQDLTPADARRLEQLQMQQRMDRQLLEQQQLQRDLQNRRDTAHLPPDLRHQRVDRERQTFAVERDLQMQQFELDQRRLMQSMPRAPLQPPIGNPQLDLP